MKTRSAFVDTSLVALLLIGFCLLLTSSVVRETSSRPTPRNVSQSTERGKPEQKLAQSNTKYPRYEDYPIYHYR